MNPGDQGLNQAVGVPVGTDPAFEAFYRKHLAAWVRYAYAETGSLEVAEQIIDAVIAHIARHWHELQEQQRAAQHTWKVLKSTVACWLDEHEAESALIGTAAFDRTTRRVLANSRDRFEEMEEAIGLYSAISHLPGRQYDSIVLRFVMGYEYHEIASILGVREGAVRANVFHAKKRIAEELGHPHLIETEA